MARWLALIAITQQISCSGGAGTSGSANINPPVSTTLSISPPSAEVSAGGTLQFTVVVQNASNSAVTWEVNGIPGGNSAVGMITTAGPAAASYTAPANVPSALMVTVAAVLAADPIKSASATVTVNPLPGPQISISPANATVVQGTSLQFSATVQNGPQAVLWEVNNIAGGSAKFGTISSSGFYAAPAQIPSPPTVTITALLFSDSSIASSTSLTIVPPVPSVSISPSTANVIEGQALQFSANVQNSTDAVVWAVNGTPGGNSIVGKITSLGPNTAAYSAPINIPLSPNPFTVTVTGSLQTDSSVSASAGVTVISGNTLAGVYSWRNDNSLTGQNAQEEVLNPASVSGLTGHTFGKLFGCPVDGAIFAQPLYVANVTVASVPHNVVYVATENDSVYAFDADNLCNTLWQINLIPQFESIVSANDPNLSAETDIVPLIGITGTPVVDPASATLYVVTKTRGIVNGSPVYSQRLHALDLTSGSEKFGAPTLIQAIVPGTGGGSVSGSISFQSLSATENQRSALSLAGGNVYVAFDSYADAEPFHGWVFAFDAADLTKKPGAVFISTPNGSNGGIGESGAAPSVDANGNLFVVTSDGTSNPGSTDNYPDTLLKLQVNSSSNTMTVLDAFTRANELSLAFQQKYFGSTGVLLVPDSAGTATHPRLALTGDEAGNLYLLDRDNLATNGSLQTVFLAGPLFGTPAFWAANTTVYVAAAGDKLEALQLASGNLSSASCALPTLCSIDNFDTFSGSYGASPVITWDGTNVNTGVVWALDTSGYPTSSPAILHAYNASDLAELYVSPSNNNGPPPAGPAVKFAVPTVANGKVYVGTENELSVFGLQ